MSDAGDDLGLPADWWGRLGHDLRGPLGPIRMAVQLLRSGRGEEAERQDALHVVDRQVDRLLGEIDDVADLMRLRNGIFSLRTQPDDLNLVLDSVGNRVSLLRALAERDQSLEVATAVRDVPADYDPSRLCALLEFLLRKAGAGAPPGTGLRLSLLDGAEQPTIELRGHDASLAADAEMDWLLATPGASAHEVGARAVLMREIARRSGVGIAFDGVTNALHLRIPPATARA